MCNRNTSVLRHALTAAVALAVCGANSFALGDEAAQIGREGQAFGKQLSNEFSFPTESGGSFNLGNGTTIGPSDLVPSGDGLYVQDPDVQGMQGVYDSDYDMDVTGRAAQGKLYKDAQAKGNPFDTNPALRNQPGPSTLSGAAYQIVLGVSDARNKVPDLSNDPIIIGSGDAMLDDSLLESFGDCSVETEVTETTRPVHMPEEEYCERVITPAPTTCTIKRELVIERVGEDDSFTQSGTNTAHYGWGCITTAVVGGRAGEVLCSGAYKSYVITGNTNPGSSMVACIQNQALFPTETCSDSHSWTITITTGTKTVPTITADRWYPEECVERALKASS